MIMYFMSITFLFSGTESYPTTSPCASSVKESTSHQNRNCNSNRLPDHSDDQDSYPNSRSSSPDGLVHSEVRTTESTSVFPTNAQQLPRTSTTDSKEKDLNASPEKPKIWSVAEMASSSKESQEKRSPSPELNSTRSKSPVHGVPNVNCIPVRPSVSLGGHLGHHPAGMSAVAPHPAHLNGLRPPWLGLSGGYPLPFHPGALAHPYLLAAATPHVGSPMGNFTQSSLRTHHDLLKLQAASMQMNGNYHLF